MAGIGKLTKLVFLSILLLTSRILDVSSAQVEPSTISEADESTRMSDDKDNTQEPHWHIGRGLKSSVGRSKWRHTAGSSSGLHQVPKFSKGLGREAGLFGSGRTVCRGSMRRG